MMPMNIGLPDLPPIGDLCRARASEDGVFEYLDRRPLI
jgi:hypothetical protein